MSGTTQDRDGTDPSLDFLTVGQVSRLLKIRKAGVYGLISSGRLLAARMGRRVRVSRAELRRFVEASSQVPLRVAREGA